MSLNFLLYIILIIGQICDKKSSKIRSYFERKKTHNLIKKNKDSYEVKCKCSLQYCKYYLQPCIKDRFYNKDI